MNTKGKQRKKTIYIVIIAAVVVMGGLIVGQALQKGSADGEVAFKDLPSSHDYYDTVMWAIDQGITTGYPDDTFKPNKSVTEAEFLAMLFRTFQDEDETEIMESGEELESDIEQDNNAATELEPEASKASWATNYYHMALEKNWNVWGQPSRNQIISRVDMALILTSALGYNLSADGAIQTILDLGLSEGKISPTIDGFGYGELSRVEALKTMENLVNAGVTELKDRPVNPSPEPELDSEFMTFIAPLKEVAEDLGYTFYSVAWSREAGFRLGDKGIVFLTYRSVRSPYNQVVLYAAHEKDHRELVRDIFQQIGIEVSEGFDDTIRKVASERETAIKEYGHWELELSPGNIKDMVQIGFWKTE
jgi:hypothetical protein